ncbi:chitinase 2-like isoform X2 [Phalaenopsis equestris]|uniref:chitinase 2-like isoform X1 n=1 Tax=Phalaenopsis equestris TaxID=78828 RepID=UPI0009E1C855|nr:chitinase 2-like isoform X1 [Phalaenopsis equestris]XP_020590641.1 chitinase 2-like isoform X2 [Phalaenopsis equestris]
MNSSSSAPLSSLLLLLLLSPLTGAQNSNHFAEYIGAEFTGVKFSDVPINSGVDFHFILSFAIDYTTSTSPPSPTNGEFSVYWDSGNLSPADVSAIKQANPNVKVAVSIGGATVSGQTVFFNPSSADSWVANAVASLTTIIQQYNLDGLDIDYESFQADSPTFADCIGRLITTLKNNNVISFASIAPFDNSDVQGHYQALWASYAGVIDFVNFQFYAYSSGTTVSQFLSYYDIQKSNYAGGQVLVSFSTEGSGGLSPANGFFDACNTLKGEGKLSGIFVWTADTSKSNGFQYETQAQSLLAS